MSIRAIEVKIKSTLVASAKVDGEWTVLGRDEVTHGMQEASQKAAAMYAAGADRVTLLQEFVLSDEDKAFLREQGDKALAEAEAEKKAAPKGWAEVEGGAEGGPSNVADLANVKAQGRA